MTRRCLVYVYGPQNIIPAICAVKWYGFTKCNNEGEEVLIILHNPGISDEIAFGLKKIVTNLISAQMWPEPLLITNDNINTIRQHRFSRYNSILRHFKEHIGGKSFDEIYYPHDLVGRAVELSISAYPNAKRIIFGDGMGQLYSKDYLDFINQPVGKPNFISGIRNKFFNLMKGKSKPFSPDYAVAILPMDWSGQFLKNIELLVVPRYYVQKIISECVRNAPDIYNYTRMLLGTTYESRFLLILSNLSETGFISMESEIALNLEIIYSNIPKNSTIIIKCHPFTTSFLEKTLMSRLSNDYDIQIISPEYNRYPVEIWKDLIVNSNIICISASSISISYIFEKPVIYPMNEKIIRQFFPKKSWKLMDDCHKLYQSQLNNLATWDGKSVLWSGQNLCNCS